MMGRLSPLLAEGIANVIVALSKKDTQEISQAVLSICNRTGEIDEEDFTDQLGIFFDALSQTRLGSNWFSGHALQHHQTLPQKQSSGQNLKSRCWSRHSDRLKALLLSLIPYHWWTSRVRLPKNISSASSTEKWAWWRFDDFRTCCKIHSSNTDQNWKAAWHLEPRARQIHFAFQRPRHIHRPHWNDRQPADHHDHPRFDHFELFLCSSKAAWNIPPSTTSVLPDTWFPLSSSSGWLLRQSGTILKSECHATWKERKIGSLSNGVDDSETSLQKWSGVFLFPSVSPVFFQIGTVTYQHACVSAGVDSWMNSRRWFTKPGTRYDLCRALHDFARLLRLTSQCLPAGNYGWRKCIQRGCLKNTSSVSFWSTQCVSWSYQDSWIQSNYVSDSWFAVYSFNRTVGEIILDAVKQLSCSSSRWRWLCPCSDPNDGSFPEHQWDSPFFSFSALNTSWYAS